MWRWIASGVQNSVCRVRPSSDVVTLIIFFFKIYKFTENWKTDLCQVKWVELTVKILLVLWIFRRSCWILEPRFSDRAPCFPVWAFQDPPSARPRLIVVMCSQPKNTKICGYNAHTNTHSNCARSLVCSFSSLSFSFVLFSFTFVLRVVHYICASPTGISVSKIFSYYYYRSFNFVAFTLTPFRIL